jgi:hypothetical protein
LGQGHLVRDASVTVARALRADDLAAAYRLVHDTFLDEDLLVRDPRGMRLRPFELVPEMATFVARSRDRVVGVMSVIPDSPDLGLPADRVFRDELDRLRSESRRVIEITNLALSPEFRNKSTFLELARAVTALALELDTDDAFVAVSPKHVAFFELILRFTPWGSRRSYRADALDPVLGLRLEVPQFEERLEGVDELLGEQTGLHAWFFGDNPHLASVREERRAAEAAFLDEAVQNALLGDSAGWLEQLLPTERVAVRRRWDARKTR